MTDKYKPPVESNRDLPMKIARGAAGAIPYIGGLLQEIIQTPLEERRDQWRDEVAHGLRKLEEQVEGFSPENLKDRPEFISAVLHASQMAMRTHQKEKREALRNAVLNVATRRAPDEDRQMMFLSWIDTFTPWHLKILALFNDHPRAAQTQIEVGEGLSGSIETFFPELRGQRSFYKQVWRDLWGRGLMQHDSIDKAMNQGGARAKQTTELAREFVRFITSPISD